LFLCLLLLLVVKSTEMGHLPWIVSVLTAFGASLILPLSLGSGPVNFLAHWAEP
jgi:hypothetical protein